MRKPQLKQAMATFEQLIESLGGYHPLILARRKDGWHLAEDQWDYYEVEGERGELIIQNEHIGTFSLGSLSITRKGAIRSLNFGDDYQNLCVLDQLRLFLREQNDQSYHGWTFRADCRQNGNVIDVEVVSRREEQCSGKTYMQKKTLATFAFDPAHNLLLYRA